MTADLRADRSTTGLELELLYSRQKLVIDGRPAAVEGIDSSCLEVNNLEKLKSETRLIKQMGLDGKSVIHPCQIPTVHEVFPPNIEELRHEEKVIRDI